MYIVCSYLTSQMWMFEWRNDGRRERGKGKEGSERESISHMGNLSKVYIPVIVIVSFSDRVCVGRPILEVCEVKVQTWDNNYPYKIKEYLTKLLQVRPLLRSLDDSKSTHITAFCLANTCDL